MTTSPNDTGQIVLTDLDHRASALARALGGRRVKRGGVRHFLAPGKARQFEALYAAGFWPVRRSGAVMFSRDPRPRLLYDALAVCKPLDNGDEGSQENKACNARTHTNKNDETKNNSPRSSAGH